MKELPKTAQGTAKTILESQWLMIMGYFKLIMVYLAGSFPKGAPFDMQYFFDKILLGRWRDHAAELFSRPFLGPLPFIEATWI